MFVGRARELGYLRRQLAETHAGGSDRPGRCVLVRGRRRIGKSSLVEQFLAEAAPPALYYTAAGADEAAELDELVAAVRESTLPDRDDFVTDPPADWGSALRRFADILPTDRPSVVVMDEVPYLMDRVDAFEGQLQRAWDRALSRRPVLLILIGSDLSTMEALSSYGRPFHQRGQELVVGPLTPADVGEMLGLAPADAMDAALVSGGLPMLCARWPAGADLWTFLADQLSDPFSPLVASAERSLAAEFPAEATARTVLGAIGSGERSFTNIARAAGGIAASTLTRALDLLITKRVIAAELPVARTPSKERRYRVTDPYLRFWFTFVAPHLPEIERMRADLTLRRIRAGWGAWRGRAVEPLVREALARLLPYAGLPAAGTVGGYWTRSHDVEIDLVGADRGPVARELLFLGSIKWRDHEPFDEADLADLLRHRAHLTDTPVPLVAVSRVPSDCPMLAARLDPADLIRAWDHADGGEIGDGVAGGGP